MTKIEWTDETWNPVVGCTKVSPGCAHCYAETMAARYGKLFAGAPRWRDSALKDYQMLKPDSACFVNTMSDSFHEGVPHAWIERMFIYARQKPNVQFLFLTKRIERALELAPRLWWSDNIWLGTSIENRKRLSRLDVLKQIRVPRKFVSVEPLLEDLCEVDWHGIDGVIVGGESGANRRPFDKAWARTIRDQCQRDGVAFFFKQGGAFKSGQDRELDGRTHDDVPWRVIEQPAPTQPAMFD